MKKDKIKKEKAPKVKKEKKVKEKNVQSPEEKAAFEAAVKGFTSSGVFKALVVLFVCSLVFTMFSSSILRLTAIPGALKSRAAAISANLNAQNNNSNNGNNNLQDVIQQIIQPDTTSASIDVQGTTAAPTTQAPATTKAPDTTTATKAPETTASSGEASTTTTTKPTTTEPLTDSPAMIKEKKAVLNTYKKVVNTANAIKPGFTKVQYRTMEKDDSAKLVLGSVEKNYPGYFISQSDAEAAPIVSAKFSDMSLFLIENGDYACLLSDKYASEAIRRVEKTEQSDGSTKITIVLRDEENPAVTPADQKTPESYTSAMFPVVDKESVKEKLVARQSMITSVTDVNLLYHDCTLEITYMPKTGKVVSVTQTVQYDCVVTYDFAVLGYSLVQGQTATGTVTDTAVYTDFVY